MTQKSEEITLGAQCELRLKIESKESVTLEVSFVFIFAFLIFIFEMFIIFYISAVLID